MQTAAPFNDSIENLCGVTLPAIEFSFFIKSLISKKPKNSIKLDNESADSKHRVKQTKKRLVGMY
jgi:hypothetical protein